MTRLFSLLLALACAAPAAAQWDDEWLVREPQYDETGRMIVDVEIVFAVDVSSSIDEEEALRQRQGHVAALADPDVISAIEAGGEGRIAVIYVEWADAGFQRPAAPWTMIASEADAMAFAAVVAAAPLERGHYTAIGSAIARSRSSTVPMWAPAYIPRVVPKCENDTCDVPHGRCSPTAAFQSVSVNPVFGR